jgi:hypothetical protein
MNSNFRIGFMILMILLLIQVSAMAITVEDLDPTDNNSIHSVTEISPNAVGIVEDYNERYLIPYPSHDGYAIVNEAGGFFDKKVTFLQNESDGPYLFIIDVKNTSPYIWSDYHFEFYSDSEFKNPFNDIGLITYWYSDDFTNSSWDGSSLNFWSPEWVEPTEWAYYEIHFDATLIDENFLYIRQIATTVPEPSNMILFGLGLLGVVRISRRI